MKRINTMIAAVSICLAPSAWAAGPTNILGQETAQILDDGIVQFDLVGSGDTQLRMGALGGVVMLALNAPSTAQYKKAVAENLAFHGGLGIATGVGGNSTTTLVLGVAYTMSQEQFILNANPVLVNSAGTTDIDLGLGAFMPFKSETIRGKLMGGVSIDIPVSPGGDSAILLGLRWDVKSDLSLEAGLYNSGSGLQFPGLLRINYTL